MPNKNKTWSRELANQWTKWTPPDRPSEGEMRVYEEFLQRMLAKKKKLHVMVLGSTSEFRNLFAKYSLPATVVDYAKENYYALGSLMKRKPYRETLVVKDWRTMKLKGKYDLILGDFCINVLPKEDQSVFIKNLAHHLTQEGLCMLKTFVRYDANRGDLTKSLTFYRTQKKHRPILETIMAPMFKYSYNFKKETTRVFDVWNNFLKLYRQKKIRKEELNYFASLKLGEIRLEVYIPYLLDILKVIESNARLYGIRFGGEWFSIDVPILIITKGENEKQK